MCGWLGFKQRESIIFKVIIIIIITFHFVFASFAACKILSAKPSGPASILVKWERYAGATNYFLDLRVRNNTNIAPVVVTLPSSQTERDVKGLRPGTQYNVTLKVFQFYYVVCVDTDVATTGEEIQHVYLQIILKLIKLKFIGLDLTLCCVNLL